MSTFWGAEQTFERQAPGMDGSAFRAFAERLRAELAAAHPGVSVRQVKDPRTRHAQAIFILRRGWGQGANVTLIRRRDRLWVRVVGASRLESAVLVFTTLGGLAVAGLAATAAALVFAPRLQARVPAVVGLAVGLPTWALMGVAGVWAFRRLHPVEAENALVGALVRQLGESLPG